jgi:hypothetical protein
MTYRLQGGCSTTELRQQWRAEVARLPAVDVGSCNMPDWQGRQESNLRMETSKDSALPLGYSPMWRTVRESNP